MIAVKSGNRNDMFLLIISIAFIELTVAIMNRRSISKLIISIVTTSFLIIGSMVITKSREGNSIYSQIPITQALIYNDYYAPSHILLAAMNYNLVDPINVIKSNAANSLVMMGYPYLQTDIGNLLIEDSSSRSTGFAYYLFSEGFMAFGTFGFIYNGFIAFFGIALWRYLATSNSYKFNLFIMALIIGQMANVARCQSAYFIKDIYILFLPAIFLFYFASGLSPFGTWHLIRRFRDNHPETNSNYL